MRSLWEELYGRLARSIITLKSHRQYSRIRQRRSSLHPFPDPASLIDFFHDQEKNLDTKDNIYRDLVLEVQSGQEEAETAARLIWMGLWPGLDATWRTHTRYYRGEEQELVAAITDHFTRHIHALTFATVRRVAATLIRNTRRDVRGQRAREWAEDARTTELPDEDLLPPHQPQEERNETRRWVWSVLDADAGLVMFVFVEGLNLKEASERLGISHAAARQRFHRAMECLRRAHAEIDS